MTTYGINVDVLRVKNWTGVERYVFELVDEMKRFPLQENEKVVLYAARKIPALEPLPDGWEWRILRWPLRKGWTHARLSLSLFLRRPDVFFAPGHEIPILGRQRKTVFTVHDVAFRRVPELYSPKERRRQEAAIRYALRRSDHLITVSDVTKSDLHELYKVPDSDMTVTHLFVPKARKLSGVINPKTLAKYGLEPQRYLLAIGRVERKKNIGMLIRAFSEMSNLGGYSLAIAGSFGYGAEEIKELAAKRVHFLGYVPEEDKVDLYRGAQVYLFPSLYEGFGIPILEAFSAKTAVIASDIPTFREVAGEAALFVDPHDVEGWTKAMENLLKDPALDDQLVRLGEKRLLQFSCRKTAQKTWDVLRSLV